MATLVDSDFYDLKKRIKRDPATRAIFKAWPLSKPILQAMFQTAEDWFVSAFKGTPPATSFKTALETVAGPITDAQAKRVGGIWMGWRYRSNP